ncbi:MAG: serine/threonine-protein phosphatase [Sphingomonadaceae bacterium]|nr:serine/threonine-protein phosphatase [Sphingomonadaceae bacterium]
MKLASLLRPFRAAPAGATPMLPTIRSCARTHAGRVRAINEDRLLDRPERGLWAVADGMGGHSAGDVAASIVIRALADVAGGEQAISCDAVLDALRDANAAIHARSSDAVSGSTVAALHIERSRFTLFWAGDSRVYRLGEHGLERLSRDHSVVQALVDSGAIAPEQARHHPQANVITRALGTGDAVDIEVAAGTVSPGDVFLLCSDGLSGFVPDDMIALHLTLPIEIAADALLSDALAAGGADNITLVLVAIPH